MPTDSPDCFRSVWKWASVLLYFTLSLMCDITNGSARVLLQLAHGKRAEGEGGVMKSFLGCRAQCNLSDEHYAFMPSFMRSPEGHSEHNSSYVHYSREQKSTFQGEISGIPLCTNLNWPSPLSSKQSILEVLGQVNSLIKSFQFFWSPPVASVTDVCRNAVQFE